MGVFRVVLSIVLEQFLDSDLFVDGDNGKVFEDNTLEIDDEYLEQAEVFGKILSAYVLFHNEVPWLYQLDVCTLKSTFLGKLQDTVRTVTAVDGVLVVVSSKLPSTQRFDCRF